MSNSSSSNSGIGLAGILTIVFVVAKILGKISWSWWWVFSPLWVSFGIGLAFLFAFAVIFVVATIFGK